MCRGQQADNSRLVGLLTEKQFEEARKDLEVRLQICHDKFRRQDKVWMVRIRSCITIPLKH